MPGRDFHRLRVAAVERLCADAVAVTFEVPEGLAAEFAFRPGQSVTVRRPDAEGDERRTYSICAPAGGRPRIGVREVPGGLVSGWLVHEARVGDTVEVAPPSGTFTPDLDAGGRHVLIAAGSGITPVLSIAASLLRHPEAQVSILYGNRRADTVMFAEELADLKDTHPARLELVHLLSREAREVDLLCGRLDGDKLRVLLPRLIDVGGVDHWWLCGPYGMVADATQVLGEAGVPAVRIHRELFWVDEAPPEPKRDEPAAGGPTSEVTVILDGRSTTVPVAVSDTVLEGEVAMRRNFALEAGELAAGFVLTCQSTPVTPKLVVTYDD